MFRKIWMQYGLIAGLLSVLLMIGLYIAGAESFLSPVAYVGYAILLVVAFLATQKAKSINDGYLEYKDALQIIFGVFVISSLCQTLFTYVLFNFISPEFRDAVAQITMEKAEEMMRKFGASDEIIEQAMEQESQKNPYSLSRMLLSFGVSSIFSFGLAALFALIVRKKKPENPFAEPNKG